MKTLTSLYRVHGRPHEVIELEEQNLPAPGAREVIVKMLAAPVNPADLNILEGRYGEQPPLPDTPGNEGVGIVEECGSDVTGVSPGDYVLTATRSWRRKGIWPVDSLIPIPKPRDVFQAAMLRVNPATAYGMLKFVRPLGEGEWVIQNAATSGVGRWVMALASRWNLRVAGLVRRSEAVEELSASFSSFVALDDDEAVEKIRTAVSGSRVSLALNAVGGDSALRLAKCLDAGGTHVTYGAMSRKALKIPNGLLIFKNLTFRGFWLRNWSVETDVQQKKMIYAELAEMLNEGTGATVPIHRIYPLDQISEALAEAAGEARRGKVLLNLAD